MLNPTITKHLLPLMSLLVVMTTPGERLVGEYTQSVDVARVLVPERLAADGEVRKNQTGQLVDDVSQGVGKLFNSLGDSLGNSLGGATAGEPKQ